MQQRLSSDLSGMGLRVNGYSEELSATSTISLPMGLSSSSATSSSSWIKFVEGDEYVGSLILAEPEGVPSIFIPLLLIRLTSELKLSMFSSTVSKERTFSIKCDTDSNFLMKTKAASAARDCSETVWSASVGTVGGLGV